MLSAFRSLSWPARVGVALLVISTLLSLGMSIASAQTVSGSMKLTWTLPTTGCTTGVTPCDNKPLTGADALTGIDVYVSAAPIPDSFSGAPTATLAAGAVTTTVTVPATNGGTLYARLKARNASGASPFSGQVSKLIVLPVTPGVPTNITIEITITP